jgi:hypothetical protein
MPKIKAVCPECAAVLALGESVTPGKNIRCPKCQTVFTVPDEVAEAAPVRSAAAAPPRRRFKAKKKSAQPGVMIAVIAASILLIVGAAVGGYFLLKSKRSGTGGSTAQTRPTPTNIQTGINVGEVAQDISAEDLDGVTFKLSDYRGKVVVLDFWGHW